MVKLKGLRDQFDAEILDLEDAIQQEVPGVDLRFPLMDIQQTVRKMQIVVSQFY